MEVDSEAERYFGYHGGAPSRDGGPAVVYYRDPEREDERWLDGRRMSDPEAVRDELLARQEAVRRF